MSCSADFPVSIESQPLNTELGCCCWSVIDNMLLPIDSVLCKSQGLLSNVLNTHVTHVCKSKLDRAILKTLENSEIKKNVETLVSRCCPLGHLFCSLLVPFN